jgi:phosphoglycolate phosphatase-like HAD superfamily hydrolase
MKPNQSEHRQLFMLHAAACELALMIGENLFDLHHGAAAGIRCIPMYHPVLHRLARWCQAIL